jgi:hypothetical protein
MTGDILQTTRKAIAPGTGNSVTIHNLNGLAPGMYILKISSGNTTEYLHMVKVEK